MKLVRDGSKEHVMSHNPNIVFRQRTESERFTLLFAKLLEEAGEFMAANDREQKLKELGDLTEVIWALAEMNEISPMEVTAQAAAKQALRGKFGSLWVMDVALASDLPKSDWTPITERRPTIDPWSYRSDGVGYSG